MQNPFDPPLARSASFADDALHVVELGRLATDGDLGSPRSPRRGDGEGVAGGSNGIFGGPDRLQEDGFFMQHAMASSKRKTKHASRRATTLARAHAAFRYPRHIILYCIVL